MNADLKHKNLTDAILNEYWNARQLAVVLEYSQYRHFLPVIERARQACCNSGQKSEDHFEDILHMVDLTMLRSPLNNGLPVLIRSGMAAKLWLSSFWVKNNGDHCTVARYDETAVGSRPAGNYLD